MNTAEQNAKRNAEIIATYLQKIKDTLGEEAMRRVQAMTERRQIMGIGNTLTFLASRAFPEAPDPKMERIEQQAADWMNSQL